MSTFTIAANNGDLGGGEYVQLALADAARNLGHQVTVVGPASPGELVALSRARGFATVAIAGSSRSAYVANLRRWDAQERAGLLWCNGLVPAFATTGRPDRVVHLHLQPTPAQAAAARAARAGARATVVPSDFLARSFPGSQVLPNWTSELRFSPAKPRPLGRRPRVGFIGRLIRGKGLVVLTAALRQLAAEGLDADLVLAGEARFEDAADATKVEAALGGLGDQVERLGWTTPQKLFATVDLVVMPSLLDESFGLVVAEAMAHGARFVISDAGALAEVAGPEHPFVAPAGDAEALAGVMRRALTDYPDELLMRARARWQDRYSPAAGRAEFASLIAELGLRPGT